MTCKCRWQWFVCIRYDLICADVSSTHSEIRCWIFQLLRTSQTWRSVSKVYFKCVCVCAMEEEKGISAHSVLEVLSIKWSDQISWIFLFRTHPIIRWVRMVPGQESPGLECKKLMKTNSVLSIKYMIMFIIVTLRNGEKCCRILRSG